jgi:hypothetical protein
MSKLPKVGDVAVRSDPLRGLDMLVRSPVAVVGTDGGDGLAH